MLSPLLTLHPVFSAPFSFLFPVPCLTSHPSISIHHIPLATFLRLFLTASRDPPYFVLCTLLFICSAPSLSFVFSILLTTYYNTAYSLNKLHFPCFTRASPLHSLVVSHKTLFIHCTLHPASSIFLTSAPSAVLSSPHTVIRSSLLLSVPHMYPPCSILKFPLSSLHTSCVVHSALSIMCATCSAHCLPPL